MAHVPGTIDRQAQFKVRYASKMGRYLPAFAILQERFPFREREKTGENYVMPILTRRVQDAKYALSGAGQIDFGDIVSSKIVKATLTGSQLFMSNGVDWESAFSSGPEKSFTDTMDLAMVDLWDSARFRLEMLTLWGASTSGSIGIVDGAPAANVVTILAKELSKSILYNLEGAKLHVWSADLDTRRAGAGDDDEYTVVSVDLDLGTITVDDDTNIATTDKIFFAGERTVGAPDVFATAAGLHRWATNTGSLAGIDASANIVWKPSEVDNGGNPLDFDTILSAAKAIQERGGMGKVCALISLGAWNNAMSDMSATVRRTPSERKYVLGAETISFFTGTGEVEVIAHPLQKDGYAHVFPVETPNVSEDSLDAEFLDRAPIRRVGATDLAFVGPDGALSDRKPDGYFEKIQRTNLLSVDVYSHQALFVSCPGRLVAVVNIVND